MSPRSTAATSPARSWPSPSGLREIAGGTDGPAPGASERIALERLADRIGAALRLHAVRFSLRPHAAPVLNRVPDGRRHRTGPTRCLPLRPARLRGARRQLPGDREGRRPGSALVPSRPVGDERPRRPGVDFVEWIAVRVLHAAAADAALSGHAARRLLPPGPRAADRIRRRAQRAVGHLRIGLQLDGPSGELSVQGVRRPRARAQARPCR